ncbi:hypothetical protein [Clostridium cibarium]|uniref:DUF5348 domain-containing protein n=1 Tax=Clostridium cibarium TaxID=2762247 RepID=A0ABR8PT26_9CLOT|nr:hypothetical protein [Clostridium cibarium]MBD7911330.1 hypothetical protein [Clostridium cibarium]
MKLKVSDAFRCMIKDETNKYYVGVDYNGKKYNIVKNENIRCKVGDDFYFYAIKERGFLRDKLIPISDEMAGVKV